MALSRQTPAMKASINGLFRARDKGRAAADDPQFKEGHCPYRMYEHRQFWLEGFRARRREMAVPEAAAEQPLA